MKETLERYTNEFNESYKELNLKQFLYRPETTFSSKDENKLGESLKKFRKEKGHSNFWSNLFDSKEDLNDTFKKAIEIIWDDLNSKLKEGLDITEFEYLLQEEIESIDHEEMICENMIKTTSNKTHTHVKSLKEFLIEKL